MSQLDDAVAKYNKLLETGPYSDLGWVEALHQRMERVGQAGKPAGLVRQQDLRRRFSARPGTLDRLVG